MKRHLSLQRLFLILISVSLLGLQNCQKESIHRETTGTAALFPVTERDSDPLSEQAYNENVTDYYEEQGKFIYEHLRYRLATVTPEEYISSSSREAYIQSMQAQKESSADKTYPQILDEYFTEGILTENEQALMLDLHNLIVAQENEDLTFGQAWYLIREWEIHTQNDQTISEDEYKYEFWGSWGNNQNSVIIYSGCSPHGQVVESGIDYVKIQWNSASPSYPTPKVTAIVKNLCSYLTVTENLDIIIH